MFFHSNLPTPFISTLKMRFIQPLAFAVLLGSVAAVPITFEDGMHISPDTGLLLTYDQLSLSDPMAR